MAVWLTSLVLSINFIHSLNESNGCGWRARERRVLFGIGSIKLLLVYVMNGRCEGGGDEEGSIWGRSVRAKKNVWSTVHDLDRNSQVYLIMMLQTEIKALVAVATAIQHTWQHTKRPSIPNMYIDFIFKTNKSSVKQNNILPMHPLPTSAQSQCKKKEA